MFKNFGPISPYRLRRVLNHAGIVILLGGLIACVIIWHAHWRDPENDSEQFANPAGPLSTSDSRKQSRQIEVYYGKTGLLFERWSEQAAAFSHGKGLVKTIGVCSVVLGVGCFLVASRMPD